MTDMLKTEHPPPPHPQRKTNSFVRGGGIKMQYFGTLPTRDHRLSSL